MSERQTQVEIDEANASHAQEVLEQEWREEFERPFINEYGADAWILQKYHDGTYFNSAFQMNGRWEGFLAAKQSSHAELVALKARVKELEQDSEYLRVYSNYVAEQNAALDLAADAEVERQFKLENRGE